MDCKPNWLSREIEEARHEINSILRRQDRTADGDSIATAIRANPQGKQLADHHELHKAIDAALDVVEKLGAVPASLMIFDRLGVPVPSDTRRQHSIR